VTSPLALADDLMSVNAALRRVVRRHLRSDLPGPHLRGAHVEVLRVVKQKPGIGVAAAAHQLGLVANTVSTVVNQLTAAGLLRREVDPDDRRAVRLHLTDIAAQRLDAWRQARTELVARAVSALSSQDRQAVADALPALRLVASYLEGGDCR
jgi:DNA-binding MarR family transcriptional regulator